MIVLNPANTLHTFSVIPRRSVPDLSEFVVFNESDATSETIAPSISTPNNDQHTFRISLTVSEGETYSFKVCKDDIIYYRGKFFVTAQAPQDYEIDSGKYTYSSI